MQLQEKHHDHSKGTGEITSDHHIQAESSEADRIRSDLVQHKVNEGQLEAMEIMSESNGNSFLKR